MERTFGSQAHWSNGKTLSYCGLEKAHAWHLLLAMAYNLKRPSKLFADRRMITQT
ncbi:transposase [Nitrosomonas sp. sh817]|uniref:transposase n=1 Tax=Nitrosomonas sp. sh817 TaxID=3070658 RepID=UPI0035A6EC39